MSTETHIVNISTEFWPMVDGDVEAEGVIATVEIERDEGSPDRIALHTSVDGRGSVTSYYFERDSAIRLAHALLGASLIR